MTTKDLAKLFLIYGDQLTKPGMNGVGVTVNIPDYDDNHIVEMKFGRNGETEIIKKEKYGSSVNS